MNNAQEMMDPDNEYEMMNDEDFDHLIETARSMAKMKPIVFSYGINSDGTCVQRIDLPIGQTIWRFLDWIEA